jgi:hypothetical protein
MSNIKSFREQSKNDWGTRQDRNPTNEEIQLGAILRMADATELMASNYTQLQKDLDWYRQMYRESQEVITHQERKIANLRGQVTKLKNKFKTQNQ